VFLAPVASQRLLVQPCIEGCATESCARLAQSDSPRSARVLRVPILLLSPRFLPVHGFGQQERPQSRYNLRPVNPSLLASIRAALSPIFVLWREGRLRLLKLPSTPHMPEQAILNGLRCLLPEPPPHGFTLLHGTTVGTNRILERKGSRTAFLTTEGFRDLLFLARQDRRQLYSLKPEPRPCLAERTLCAEVPERLGARRHGAAPAGDRRIESPHPPLEARGCGGRSLCACCLPTRSRARACVERDAVAHFAVSLSSEVAPEFREYERASTTFLKRLPDAADDALSGVA
jgi:hypothetical protein